MGNPVLGRFGHSRVEWVGGGGGGGGEEEAKERVKKACGGKSEE